MKPAFNFSQDDPRFMAFLALSSIHDSAEKSGVSNLSLNEINEEISKVRAESDAKRK